MSLRPLAIGALRRCSDPAQLKFDTTAELNDLDLVVGQARAEAALRFGIGIRREGYHLYALGPTGMGKHALVRRLLEQHARTESTPSDWCYVQNFADPQKPRALKLPAGRGLPLRRDMEQLVDELRSAIPAAFESEDYRTRKHVIEEQFKEQHEQGLAAIQKKAKERGLALLRTPLGLAIGPLGEDEQVLSPDAFRRLPDEQRQRLQKSMAELEAELRETLRKVPILERSEREQLRDVNREVTGFAVSHLIDELRRKYADLSDVVDYLAEVKRDVIEHADEFLRPSQPNDDEVAEILTQRSTKSLPQFRRYRVNVIVDHEATRGAPVVYEDEPSYANVNGRVEYRSQFGALVTDFDLIRAGALHRANGGYLMLDVRKLLYHAYAWEQLKRTLQARKVTIESLSDLLGFSSTVSLAPEPIPLDVKVVLLGERWLFYLLATYDPEFNQLFKVAVDFEDDIDRTPDNVLDYAREIATLARKDGLRALDRRAVARVIDQGARLADDAEKLAVHIESLTDLLREADYWAGHAGHEVITASDVQQAIDAALARIDRIRQRSYEQIRRGTVLLDLAGARTGQVNGLSVLQLGQYAFGQPSRITARVRMGKGEVLDIEREVELGGPIHSKGVLILAGFLGQRYAAEQPLSLSATLVFEQSYGAVEGDSACSRSCARCCRRSPTCRSSKAWP
ncbi:MAG: ATP-binding protein [Planctomycetota bacterium]